MAFKVVEFVAGLILALATLRDVFGTVVAPGPARSGLKVSRRLIRSALVARRRAPWSNGLSRNFAPLMLVASFVSWLVLLGLGFGLMLLPLGSLFTPAIGSFGDAVFAAGGAMTTMGAAPWKAAGAARWVLLAASVCGLSVMTMAVTYVLEVQSGLHQREAGVLKLATDLGKPPTGVEILEMYARLGCPGELVDLFREWREWSAAVLQSHSAHPALIYFRSVTRLGDWTAALGAVLDAACLDAVLLDEPTAGVAALAHRDGSRLALLVGRMLRVEPKPIEPPSAEALARVCGRLAAGGYRLKAAEDAAGRIVAMRRDYAGWLAAIAERIGLDGPALQI